MGINIGKVTGREIVKNRDGTNDRLMLQVEMTSAEDIQTVELRNSHGDDNSPIDGSQVLIVDVGPAFKLGIANNDGVDPDTNPGEKRIYATDSNGVVKASIHLTDDGNIVIVASNNLEVTVQNNMEFNITNNMEFKILGAGKIEFEAPVIEMNGNLIVDGNITAIGTVTGETDVIAGAISGKTHKHGGVTVGAGNTGVPF